MSSKDALATQQSFINIYVIFDYKGESQSHILQLRTNMKFSEVASLYFNKIEVDEEDEEYFKFIFNSKILDFSKTLDELGIKCGSRILVRQRHSVCGVGLSIKSILDKNSNKADPTKKKSGKKINIRFQFMHDEPIYTSLKDNLMFAEVTSQFCIQYGALMGKNNIEYDKVQFISKGGVIKSDSNKTLAELGIGNDDFILVITINEEDSSIQNIVENENKLYNSLSIKAEENSLKKEEKDNIIKKFDLNIIYYDENLKNKENNDNCSFFEMNINGTFYGCHYFELFKIICEKIKNKKKEFILLSSGSCSEKVFDYCSNVQEIREYYIYCFNIDKYKPLMDKYSKLKGIYNVFEKLKEKFYLIKPMKMNNISSSNLIFFEDYNRLYIKLHYEFIRKYLLYKILKSRNYNESQFLALVEETHPYFMNLAKSLFPKAKE